MYISIICKYCMALIHLMISNKAKKKKPQIKYSYMCIIIVSGMVGVEGLKLM